MTKDAVQRIDYWYAVVPDQPGAGHELLQKLADADVTLTACLAFPLGDGQSQVDLVPADPAAFEAAAEAAGITLSSKKQALYLAGVDRPGALAGHMQRLAAAGINCTAVAAVAGAGGDFGSLLWVKPDALDAADAALAG